MAKTNDTIKRVALTFAGAVLLVFVGYVVAGFNHLEEKKVNHIVFDQHVQHITDRFDMVQKSLDKIERKMGIYEPE